MRKWTAVAKAFDRYLRLKTFPVAFKLFESATALDGIKGIRQPDYMPRMCQLITLARAWGSLTTSVGV